MENKETKDIELYKKYIQLKQKIKLSDDVFWRPLYKDELAPEIREHALRLSELSKDEFDEILSYVKNNLLPEDETEIFFLEQSKSNNLNKIINNNTNLSNFLPGFFDDNWLPIKQNKLMKRLYITGEPIISVNYSAFFALNNIKSLVFFVILAFLGHIEILFALYLYIINFYNLNSLPLFYEISLNQLIIPYLIFNLFIYVVLIGTGLPDSRNRYGRKFANEAVEIHWWKKLRCYHPFFESKLYKILFIIGIIPHILILLLA